MSLRHQLRHCFVGLLRKAFQTDDGKASLVDPLVGLLNWQPTSLTLPMLRTVATPYSELGQSQRQPCDGANAIFITARFRSGSTLIWNLFRSVQGITAYYEPFNERKWFDPTVRGLGTDDTHRGVKDYWSEYNGLQRLAKYYDERWIERELLMDGGYWNPSMKRFLEDLISAADGRPVLQFNRIDFRLPWVRRHFPNARIVHLFRHPRDQWLSTLMGDTFPLDGTMQQFQRQDRFYLASWVRDLKYHFPFLADQSLHPYEISYYLWKLSYLFGRQFADYRLAYENLIANPVDQLQRLFNFLEITDSDPNALATTIKSGETGKWSRYADDDWFRRKESCCETVLDEFLENLSAAPPSEPSDRKSDVEPI